MAIAKGYESKEAQEFKRYVGVAPVFIKAVTPNKAQHEQLFNTTLEDAPSYVGTVTDNDGNEYKNARVQIVLQPDVKTIGFDMPLIPMALFVQNRPKVGAASGKIQVIDKYGRTAWATKEELSTHAIPMYANGPADIDKDYRPAYVGEVELTDFIKTYLGVPNITVWDPNLKKMIPNVKVKAEECECRLDNIDMIFKGDFTEITNALGFQPTNKIKVLLGVRTDLETGKLYQTVYTKKFLKNSSNNFSALDKEIQEMIKSANESGRTINTEYEVTSVHEYNVTPTTFTPTTSEVPTNEMPFDASSDEETPW